METFKCSNWTHLFYVRIWMLIPMHSVPYYTVFSFNSCPFGTSFKHIRHMFISLKLSSVLLLWHIKKKKNCCVWKLYCLALEGVHILLDKSINQAPNLCYIVGLVPEATVISIMGMVPALMEPPRNKDRLARTTTI